MPSLPTGATTLADVGESGVLAAIFPRLPSTAAVELGPGDDAAVLATPDGRVVATTDVMVEGRDFRSDWSTAYDVGWKAAAQNLADIAAMGAVPTALLVGLVAPESVPVAWVEGLADGLAAACQGTGACVVGGDLSSGDAIVVSVTALGDLQGRGPVIRAGARAGDVVALAGSLGQSAAGLALLEAGRADLAPDLVAAHLRPHPTYAAGPAAALAGAGAMLDVSDGLLRDAGRLATASDVLIDLDPAALHAACAPLLSAAGRLSAAAPDTSDGDDARAVGEAGSGRDAGPALAQAWVLTGGEDHGLLACFPSGRPLPQGFAVLGRVRTGPAGVLVGGQPATDLVGSSPGWDHFAPSAP